MQSKIIIPFLHKFVCAYPSRKIVFWSKYFVCQYTYAFKTTLNVFSF